MAILTTLQVDILKLTKESRKELNDIFPEQNQILVAQQIERLLQQNLLDAQEGPDGPQYGATASALIELRRVAEIEKKKGGPLVPPRSYNYLAEVYVPPKSAYVRNGGNSHIPSRGL